MEEKWKNTLEELQQSAFRGGYTHLLLMPNTNPTIDNVESLKRLKEEAKLLNIKLYYSGSLTKGRRGKEYSPYISLYKEGVRVFTDDGTCPQEASKMYNIARELSELDCMIMEHPELEELTQGTYMSKSVLSDLYGIPSQCSFNENIVVYRDLCIAKDTGAKFHFTHISTAESVRLIGDFRRFYKLPVSFDITLHHLLLSVEDINRFDGFYNVKPYLRVRSESSFLQECFLKNEIEVVASDHAPHSETEKGNYFADAPYGFVNLEIAFGLLYTLFVKSGKMSLTELVRKLSLNPAKILNVDIKEVFFDRATFVIWDLEKSYKIVPQIISSRAKNTPFLDRTSFGEVKYIFLDGKIVYMNL
jgi:dihydroorotase